MKIEIKENNSRQQRVCALTGMHFDNGGAAQLVLMDGDTELGVVDPCAIKQGDTGLEKAMLAYIKHMSGMIVDLSEIIASGIESPTFLEFLNTDEVMEQQCGDEAGVIENIEHSAALPF